MQLIEDTDDKHLAKDGKYYDTYEEMRAANIRCNQERLREQGLDGDSLLRLKSKDKTIVKKRVNRKTEVSERKMMTRSSNRGSGSAQGLVITPKTLEDIATAHQKPRKKRHEAARAALSNEDRHKLRKEVEWLGDFENYLTNVEEVSKANVRNVMRQVEKLVSGEGITYTQWKEGTFFLKGRHISLDEDFEELYRQAVQFEREHGKDLGNGWLVRHPLKKIQYYQRYKLAKVGETID